MGGGYGPPRHLHQQFAQGGGWGYAPHPGAALGHDGLPLSLDPAAGAYGGGGGGGWPGAAGGAEHHHPDGLQQPPPALPGGAPRGSGPRVYVGGVPTAVSETMVRAHFGQWGAVLDVYFPKDRATGRRKNYCFVTFASPAAAEAAAARSNREIGRFRVEAISVTRDRTSHYEAVQQSGGRPPPPPAGASPLDGWAEGGGGNGYADAALAASFGGLALGGQGQAYGNSGKGWLGADAPAFTPGGAYQGWGGGGGGGYPPAASYGSFGASATPASGTVDGGSGAASDGGAPPSAPGSNDAAVDAVAVGDAAPAAAAPRAETAPIAIPAIGDEEDGDAAVDAVAAGGAPVAGSSLGAGSGSGAWPAVGAGDDSVRSS